MPISNPPGEEEVGRKRKGGKVVLNFGREGALRVEMKRGVEVLSGPGTQKSPRLLLVWRGLPYLVVADRTAEKCPGTWLLLWQQVCRIAAVIWACISGARVAGGGGEIGRRRCHSATHTKLTLGVGFQISLPQLFYSTVYYMCLLNTDKSREEYTLPEGLLRSITFSWPPSMIEDRKKEGGKKSLNTFFILCFVFIVLLT